MTLIHRIGFACAVVISVGGCSGSGLPSGAGAAASGAAGGAVPSAARPAAAPHRGWLSPAAKRAKLIFVSDNSANAIVIYRQGQSNPSPIGEITDGISAPLGNFVDSKGTLYVANNGNNTVTEYPHGSTSPSVTISNNISGPISVAVDRNGNLAVGEFSSGTILKFPSGSTAPSVTITLLTLPEALAFDRARHLFAAWNQNSGSGLTGEVSKCVRMKPICVSKGITEGESGGLAIDQSGDLILGDQTNSVINIYAPSGGTPIRTISTTGRDPYKFELDKPEKTLYVADIKNGVVALYDYASGTQMGTISNGLQSAWGVSLYPAAKDGP